MPLIGSLMALIGNLTGLSCRFNAHGARPKVDRRRSSEGVWPRERQLNLTSGIDLCRSEPRERRCIVDVVEETLSLLRAAAAVLATLLIGSCAASMPYRAADVPNGPPSSVDHIKGRVLVYTTQTDDDRLITPGATSLTAFKMSVQAGVIAREIAVTVFSRVADGADKSHDLGNAATYAIVFRPEIENIEYGFEHPERLGTEVTPQVRVVMRITLLDASGRVLLEKDYDSGPVSKGRSKVSEQLVERTDELTHQAIYELMLRAARDIHVFQQTEAAAASLNQASDR